MFLPQDRFILKYGLKLNSLGGTWAAGNFRRGTGCSHQEFRTGLFGPFLSWRISERVEFGERAMGLPGSSRSELEVLAKHPRS